MDNSRWRKRKLDDTLQEKKEKRQRLDTLSETLKEITPDRKKKLRDLHTHLLGMGSAKFWLDNLILDQRILPSEGDFRNDKLLKKFMGPLIWNEEEKVFFEPEDVHRAMETISSEEPYKHEVTKLLMQKIEALKKYSISLSDFKALFTYDVVYHLDNLRTSFDLPKANSDIVQSQLENILGLHTSTSASKIAFEPYVIWNARKQEFNYIPCGLCNGDLQHLLASNNAHSQALRSYLINSFSMCNREGEEASLVDLHAYRGNWAQFYPRRYKLKDSLYEQRLDVLAYLLKHCLHNYATCSPPVEYIEFSMGAGDLSRPWLLEVLTIYAPPTCQLEKSNSFQAILSAAEKESNVLSYLDYSNQIVEYHFLAGFNRFEVTLDNIVGKTTPIDLLIENGDKAIEMYSKEFNASDSTMFDKAIKALKDFAQVHQKHEYLQGKISSEDNAPRFTYWIVGFDLFGEELGYPYCPFVTQPFLVFIKAAMVHNPKFGVRIHCAETIPIISPHLPGYALYCNHLFISFVIIQYLIANNIRVRIGHGVLFTTVLKDKKAISQRKSALKLQHIVAHAQQVFPKTVFELNLTSNYYLLHNPAVEVMDEGNVLHYLVSNHPQFPVILSTDDDGIWPLDSCHHKHFAHHSLAHEICRATSENLIDGINLRQMLSYMETFSFHGTPSSPAEEAFIDSTMFKSYTEVVPPFLLEADVASMLHSLCTGMVELQNQVLKHWTTAESKAEELDTHKMQRLASILAHFVGDQSTLADSDKQIIDLVKTEFLGGQAFQSQMLHIVDKAQHIIVISQPKGTDHLISSLSKLANDTDLRKDKVSYYIFMNSFDEHVISELVTLWEDFKQKPTAHIFTKSKNRLEEACSSNKGNILINESSESIMRTYPLFIEESPIKPLICFFGFNSSAASAIVKLLLSCEGMKLISTDNIYIDNTIIPFFTEGNQIVYQTSDDKTKEENKQLLESQYPNLPATVTLAPLCRGISQKINEKVASLWNNIQNLQLVNDEELHAVSSIPSQLAVICARYSITPINWCVVTHELLVKYGKPMEFSMFHAAELDNNQYLLCTKAKYEPAQEVRAQYLFNFCNKTPAVFSNLRSALKDLCSEMTTRASPEVTEVWAKLLIKTIYEAGQCTWNYVTVGDIWRIIEDNLLAEEKFKAFFSSASYTLSARNQLLGALTNSSGYRLGNIYQRSQASKAQGETIDKLIQKLAQ